MTCWLADAAVVGKVPWEYEFLPAPEAPTLRTFDDWLFRSASSGTHAWGNDRSVYAFATNLDPGAGAQALSVGVLSRSEDRAGRGYVAAVVATLATSAAQGHPEILPVLLESFWSRALDGLTRACEGPIERGDAAVASLTRDPIEPIGQALALYTDWTRSTVRSHACAQLARQPGWLDIAVDRAAAALRPDRSNLQSTDGRAVRVPLGQAAGATLCFWLDVAWRAAGRRGPYPSFFWSHDGQSGQALIALPVAPPTTLGLLWGGPREGRLLDLVRLGEQDEPDARLELSDPSLEALLGDDGPIGDLLEIVG